MAIDRFGNTIQGQTSTPTSSDVVPGNTGAIADFGTKSKLTSLKEGAPVTVPSIGTTAITLNPPVTTPLKPIPTVNFSAQPIEPLQQDDLIEFLPNALDAVDSPTYHFRLLVTAEENFLNSTPTPYANNKFIVLAESGVTSVAIEDVDIQFIPSGTQETSTGIATKVSLTIKQPLGVDFLDQIVTAAQTLGINNYQTAPYFLELSFRGRDPYTSAPVTSDVFGNKVWIWPLTFTQINVKVDTGGSVYTIDAVLLQDHGYLNQASDLLQPISITAATVEDFADQLTQILNKRQVQNLTDKQFIPDLYQINIHQDLQKIKISPADSQLNASRTGDYNDGTSSNRTIQFTDGTSIQSAIEMMLTNTEYFRKQYKKSLTPGDDKDRKETIQDNFKKIFSVICSTKIGKYDQGRQDYSKIYTYTVVPYNMSTPIAQPGELSKTSTTQQQIVQMYSSRKILQKRYFYIYTGLNDQVLDFDFNFSTSYYIPVPRLAGVYSQYTSNDIASKAKTSDLKVYNSLSDKIAKYLSLQANPKNKDSAALQSESIALTNQIRQDASKGLLTESDANGLQNAVNFGTNLNTGTLAPSDLPSTTNPIQQGTNSGINYGEDVFENVTQQTIQQTQTSNQDKVYITKAFKQSNDDKKGEFGTEGSFDAGRTYLSTIFNQFLSGDHVSIDLKIKGDPYWIQPAPVVNSGEATVLDINDVNNTNDNTATFTMYQNYIAFITQTPQQSGDNGLVQFNDNSLMSGIYAVVLVDSKFSGGLFTQTLKCVRDVTLQYGDIKNIVGNLNG